MTADRTETTTMRPAPRAPSPTSTGGADHRRSHLHRRWVPSRQARAITSLRLANEISDPVEHRAAIDRHFQEFVFASPGDGRSCLVRR